MNPMEWKIGPRLAAAMAVMLALPVMAQNTSTPRDGTPGNPSSTATQRAADSATGSHTPADGTPGSP